MIDLSPVEFIDAVGMQAIVGSVRLARAFGATARVCNARPPVQRLMELVGVYPLVTGSRARNGPAATPLTRGGIRAGELSAAELARRSPPGYCGPAGSFSLHELPRRSYGASTNVN